MTDDAVPSDDKSPIEQAVDHALELFVYAPIGLIFDGANVLPELVEKGRSQVTMARMVGRFAVAQGSKEATKAAGKLSDQAAGMLDLLAGAAVAPIGDEPAPTPARHPRRTASTGGSGRAVAAARTSSKAAGAPAARRTATATRRSAPRRAPARQPAKAGPSSRSLAIPDYDGLSASHVVNRLAGLTPAELDAVRAYEAAHRGRKTILSKIAQLQSA